MNYLTNEVISLAIQNMNKTFDSHQIIFWIMENEPKKYIKELYDNYIEYQNPFQQLHAVIGKKLLEYDIITQKGKVESINVLGKNSQNELWEKN